MGVFKGYQPNIFRAVSGSLFSTAANWSRGYVPTGSDVATIADNCVIDVSRTIGSLVVRAPFTASINTELTLLVKDIIDVKGHLSCSGAPNIISEARKNNINSLSPASSSFLYSGSNQNVAGGPYFDLTIYGTGVKSATANTIVNRSLSLGTGVGPSGFLELGPYDLSVYGNTTVGANGYGVLSKSKFGNLLFVGSFANGNRTAAIRFSDGNPNVEFRSGIITANSNPSSDTIQSGIGTWTFTSPTQTLQGWASFAPLNLDANIIISSSAVLNVYGGYNVSNPINGAGSSSRLVMLANNLLTFTTAKALVNSMTTGSVDFTSSYNIIAIGGNYSATIPTRFNAFRDLSISGTGIKTLGTSSFISGSLTFSSPAILELSSSNLIVSGATSISQGTTLQKIFPGGTASFYGGISFPQGLGTLNLTGSPYVEVRGGMFVGNNNPTFQSGNNKWVFSTNNQTISNNNGPGSGMGFTFNCPIIVSGPISLSLSSPGGSALSLNLFSPIDGDHPSSSFVNTDGILNFYTTSSVNCMATSGTISYFSTSSSNIYNGVGYYMNQDFTIPLNIFNNLSVGGTGTKTLSSNTVVRRSIGLAFPSTLDAGNYNLTVTGSVGGSIFKKSGPGKIIIGGTLITSNGRTDFSTGSCDVELKGGWITGNGVNLTGTGSWYFSGPTQSLSFNVGNNDSITFQAKGLISSSAQFILTGSSAGVVYTLFFPSGAYMNGESSTSVFNNRRNVIYQNPDAPMLTGSLWSSVGSFTYNYTGSQTQSIQIPTDPINPSYLNLTLSGSTKILLGNINVTGTITTGSTVINYNGFTITKI